MKSNTIKHQSTGLFLTKKERMWDVINTNLNVSAVMITHICAS